MKGNNNFWEQLSKEFILWIHFWTLPNHVTHLFFLQCILSIIKNDGAKNQDNENFTSGGFEKAG